MFAVAFVAGVTAVFFWLLCVRARGRGGLSIVAVVSITPFPAGATTTPLSIPTSTFSVHTLVPAATSISTLFLRRLKTMLGGRRHCRMIPVIPYDRTLI